MVPVDMETLGHSFWPVANSTLTEQDSQSTLLCCSARLPVGFRLSPQNKCIMYLPSQHRGLQTLTENPVGVEGDK